MIRQWAKAASLRAEAALVRLALALFRALDPVAASNLGGALARTIGPRLPVSRVADANLRLAMPELDAAARRRVIRGAWDNLGRTAAEFPHLTRLRETASGPGWEVVGAEIAQALAAQGGPAIFASAHLANWEIMPLVCAARARPLATVYRAASNPFVDKVIRDLRDEAAGGRAVMFPKGAVGARDSVAHLLRGGWLGMLVDQKMNDGVPAKLFGHVAMTARAPAAFALRYGSPLLPAHVERLGPARLRVILEPPLPMPNTGDRTADVQALTEALNARLERWIRARPEEWLWMHRRWPKEAMP
jgi:Kdo2-lipid IVA lauroyltransferase/acyltransferase